ncbi:hypothetical protein ACOSQ4_025242 [Xanthoceras sorbifolium]
MTTSKQITHHPDSIQTGSATQHKFTHCPDALQTYPAPTYKLPMFTSLELLHHIPTQPRAPPAKQQPSEEKTAEDRDSINHEMKLPTVSVKDLPPPLPQATEEPYTNLKHQKTRVLTPSRSPNTTRKLPMDRGGDC